MTTVLDAQDVDPVVVGPKDEKQVGSDARAQLPSLGG
jgi:hypothetical protein